jgi:hypothetical protein
VAQSALSSVNGNFKLDRNIKTILKGRYESEPSKEIEQFLAGAAHPETIPGQKSASGKLDCRLPTGYCRRGIGI